MCCNRFCDYWGLVKPIDQKITVIENGFSGSSAGKESTCNAGDLDLIPGLGRSPGEGNGYPLQYSGLKISMDCLVHGVSKGQTRLSDFQFSLALKTAMLLDGWLLRIRFLLLLIYSFSTMLNKLPLWCQLVIQNQLLFSETSVVQPFHAKETFKKKSFGLQWNTAS